MTMRDIWTDTARATHGATAHRVPEPAAPAVADLPLYQLEIAEEATLAVREIDPLLTRRAIVRLAAPWGAQTVPVTREDGQLLWTATGTDFGQEAVELSWDAYSKTLESVGAETMPEPRADYVTEARAWAARALLAMPSTPLAVWRGEDRARRTQVADALRSSFCIPAAEAERLAGAPPPARTLWAGQDAARLDEKRRLAEEAARAAQEQVVAVQVEAARPKTARELGVVVYVCERYRPGVPHGAEIWPGALRMVVHSTKTVIYFGHRALPGVHAPPAWASNGVRLCAPDEVVPAEAVAFMEPDRASLEFLDRIRRDAIDPALFGAMRTLRAEASDEAHAMAKRWAPAILSPTPGLGWRLDWLAEVLVRSLALRPDIALTQVLLPALDAAFQAAPHNQPVRIPVGDQPRDLEGKPTAARQYREVQRYADSQLPSREMRDVVAARLVAAVARGEWVACNEPLDPPQLSEPSEHATTTKTRTKKA